MRVFIEATIWIVVRRSDETSGERYQFHARVYGYTMYFIIWLGCTGESLPESEDADERQGGCI
jgi:hypothetical protein